MSNLKSKLEEISKRAENATEGPWQGFELGAWGGQGYGVNLPCTEIQKRGNETKMNCFANDNKFANPKDAFFIAHARSDIPKLLAVIEKLIEQRDYIINQMEDGEFNFPAPELNAELEKIWDGAESERE